MTKEEISKIIEKEGDFKKFEYRGLRCYIVRKLSGHWCGYVECSYPIKYKEEEQFDVHGGVSFNTTITPYEYKYPDIHENVPVLGFDCAHYQDIIPMIKRTYSGTYRTKEYVENECKKLADQILERGRNENGCLS